MEFKFNIDELKDKAIETKVNKAGEIVEVEYLERNEIGLQQTTRDDSREILLKSRRRCAGRWVRISVLYK